MKNLKTNQHTQKKKMAKFLSKLTKVPDICAKHKFVISYVRNILNAYMHLRFSIRADWLTDWLTDFTTIFNLFWSCIPGQVRGRGHLHHPCRPGWGHHLTVYPLGCPFLLWFGRDLRGLLSGGIPLLFLWILWQW